MERSIEEVNYIAKQLYRQYWGLVLDIPIIVNPRMRKWSARYMREYIYSNDGRTRIGTRGKSIELSTHVMQNYREDGLIDIVKHELCHHACFSAGKPFVDGSEYFERELVRIGACSHSHSSEELIARGYVPRQPKSK